jgi:hypothetical protein
VRAVLARRKEQGGGVQRCRRDRGERGAVGKLHDQNHQTQKGVITHEYFNDIQNNVSLHVRT